MIKTETDNVAPAMETTSQSRQRSTAQQPPALLIVEDDEGDFMLLKRALYKAGATARVWWAHNVEEALGLLEQLQRSSAHICVVTDVRLSGFDGLELLAQIKRRVTSSRVKCALLTGMTDRMTRERANAEGVDAFFVKPCDTAELLHIARALQKLASS